MHKNGFFACDAPARKALSGMIQGAHLGHQMGQWSERAWWKHCLPNRAKAEQTLDTCDALLDPRNMDTLITHPPFIETPGWGPTGFDDTMKHIAALGLAYNDCQRSLTPEDFRDFLLRERGWLQLQGVGRSCIELMDEGMNPRIAGLFAGSVASGCWVAWPAAAYHAGNPDDAYENAVSLCRTQSGGDIVELAGALAAALAQTLVPDSTWPEVRAALLQKLSLRNPRAAEILETETLCAAENASGAAELLELLRSEEYFARVSVYHQNIDWMQSVYAGFGVAAYALTHDISWTELMRLSLLAADTRFCTMIAGSLYGAIRGTDWPELWTTTLAESRHALIGAWMQKAPDTLYIRVCGDVRAAGASLVLTGGADGAVPLRETVLYDRVLAANMVGAAANAMGSPVEDRDYSWIVEKHGVVDKLQDMSRFEAEDDAAMALMWSETYIERGGRIYAEDLGDTFRRRMNPNNFYYDTQVAYQALMGGLSPHACGHWNVVTGSALMGCNSVGVYHVGRPELAAADGLELSYHYQRGFDVYAASMLCAATAEALTDGATVRSVIDAALNAAPRHPMACFNCTEKRYARAYFERVLRAVEGQNDVLAARETLYDFLEYNGQDPWEVIAFTLAIFKVAGGDPWQAALGGTNIGRDSDTIACQAAFLSVCLTGSSGVPAYFKTIFSESFRMTHERIALGLCALVRTKAQETMDTARKLGVDTSCIR